MTAYNEKMKRMVGRPKKKRPANELRAAQIAEMVIEAGMGLTQKEIGDNIGAHPWTVCTKLKAMREEHPEQYNNLIRFGQAKVGAKLVERIDEIVASISKKDIKLLSGLDKARAVQALAQAFRSTREQKEVALPGTNIQINVPAVASEAEWRQRAEMVRAARAAPVAAIESGVEEPSAPTTA